MINGMGGVVNYTDRSGGFNLALRSESWQKKISSTTPVIYAIMSLTVKTVKLLNNVVVGIGNSMKSSKTAPQWAVDLVIEVCADYKRTLPSKFQWFNRSRKETCGHVSYDKKKLHVAGGKEDWQHSPVLLHELSHWIIGKTRKGRREGHNTRFWTLFWELNAKYGDVALAYKRDVELAREWRPGTRAKALTTYDRLPKEKAPDQESFTN